jgi:nucleoredoxin
MAFTDVFGSTLLTKEGEKPTEEVLAGATAVGIYFSAHWCPPCRGFTPKLSEWYESSLKNKGMKIVFVSSDRDEEAFNSYYSEQPWAALPFANRDLKAKLNKTYKVQGIPSFVILSSDGALITKDGRDAVTKDPTGEKYPWEPPTPEEKAKLVLDILGPELVQKASGKAIGLYFSAHWCPPCRGFTPKLAEFYNNGLKEKMEIVFVSSDRDENQFKEYSREMPWLSLPYEKRKEKELLSDAFGVQGIPSFVVLNSDGTVITTEGRAKVMSDPKGDHLPEAWLPQPFNDVNDDPSPLNEEQCVIMLGGTASANEAVKAVANEYYAAAGRDIEKMPMRFFSGPDGSVTAQLRKLTDVENAKLILLDIPSDGAYYVCDKATNDINEVAVREFIDNFKADRLERKQLSRG